MWHQHWRKPCRSGVRHQQKGLLAKVYIALKECAETKYWLELLNETGYLTDIQFQSVYSDCEELRKMLSATTKTINSTLHSSHSTLEEEICKK